MKFKLLFVCILFLGLFLVENACSSKPFRQGEILYLNFCSNCHMEDGSGLGAEIPPLAQADWIKKDPAKVACTIRYGLEGKIEVNGLTYEQPMAAIPQLSDFEITNIVNYINQAWGNDFGYVPFESVQAAIKACKAE